MEIILTKKPKSPIVIEGFPGVGLIAPITTEFLIKHLNAKSIGHIKSDELLPVAAVHNSRLLQPLEIFYVEKENLVILHALSDIRGLEWKISRVIAELCNMLKASELITIEGIMSQAPDSHKAYYLSSNEGKNKKMDKVGIGRLQEGILVGVTAALLLHDAELNVTGLLVETNTKLPDSKSAALVVEILDKYLGLTLDTAPLIKAAEEFEKKLKDIYEQTKESLQQKKQKDLDYLG